MKPNTDTTHAPMHHRPNLSIDPSLYSQSLSRMADLMAHPHVSTENLLSAVYDAIDEVVDGMRYDTLYTCEALVGAALWSHWPTNGQHRAMGIALSVLVKSHWLPLQCVTPRRTNKLYALASPDTVNAWKQRRQSALEQCGPHAMKAVAPTS